MLNQPLTSRTSVLGVTIRLVFLSFSFTPLVAAWVGSPVADKDRRHKAIRQELSNQNGRMNEGGEGKVWDDRVNIVDTADRRGGVGGDALR